MGKIVEFQESCVSCYEISPSELVLKIGSIIPVLTGSLNMVVCNPVRILFKN
jgi:hypothetical protein